jgi:RNA polymerase sigma-19 factor, ECF subfamily
MIIFECVHLSTDHIRMLKTEKDYIIELKEGSFSAFDHIFSYYKARLYAFALGYLKHKEDAQELVQDVFVKVWENRETLDESKSFNSYLFTISKNTILNHIRKKGSINLYSDYIKNYAPQTHNTAEDKLEYEDLLKKAKEVIDQLPDRQKEIYLLRHEKGLSNLEIAKELRISKKTVENQITLAIKFLRERLGHKQIYASLFISLFL